MFTQTHNRTGAAGFSLTELLTVLGIVGILAAILLPVFFAVRENGRRSVCLSNLRQIGQAFSQYVSDYDGAFPGAVTVSKTDGRRRIRGALWTRALRPYTGNVLLSCPDRALPGAFAKPVGTAGTPRPETLVGYAMNYRISEETRLGEQAKRVIYVKGKAETLFTFPTLTLLVFDARTGIAARNTPDVHPLSRATPEYLTKWRDIPPDGWQLSRYGTEIREQTGGAMRHSGGANYLLADGHVKWLKPEAISPSPTCDGIHPGFGL